MSEIDSRQIDVMEEKSTILVVDDDDDLKKLTTDQLRREGYNVLNASNGSEAFNLIQNLIPPPDLVLSDIQMPTSNGLELCQKIKESPQIKDVPVILITGGYHEKEKSESIEVIALKMGACDFIEKPIERAIMVVRIQTHLKLAKLLKKERAEKNEMEIKIADLQKEIIYRLLRACEYKDEDTGNHIKRISYYCVAIAEAIEKEKDFCARIAITSSLHDIGKVGIPESILLKPGKLTKEEFDIIKTHTIIGAELLSGELSEDKKNCHLNRLLQDGYQIAYTHHEKWDGSGYPNGFRGEEIPLEGRITAIADVFDALTMNRPYKDAYSFEKAKRIMIEGRGTHFDPYLLDVFFSLENKILEIKNKFADKKED